MLFLNEKDILEAVTMVDVIDAIDEAYKIYEEQQFNMPVRTQVKETENTLILMPCITDNVIGTKLVTSFPRNTDHPTLHGLIILNCSETGEMKALLDGSFLTGFRTGAIGGSAIRHLAAKGATKLAIIGTGVQGFYQAIAACAERSITDIYLYNRSIEKLEGFKESLTEWVGDKIQLHTTNSVEDAIEHAEIIITATTSSEPVLPDKKYLLENKLVIGIGSFQPDQREFPKALYEVTDKILIDTDDAIEESGDIKIPLDHGWITKDSVQSMSSYLPTKSDNGHKGVIFKSTGMALFDVVVADLIYQRAIEKEIGSRLQ